MHEHGYTFDTIPGRTWAEVNTLQLGWLTHMERQSGGTARRHSTSPSEQRKRDHRESIRQRLIKN